MEVRPDAPTPEVNNPGDPAPELVVECPGDVAPGMIGVVFPVVVALEDVVVGVVSFSSKMLS